MIRLLQTIIFLLPLLLTAETITIKTKAPQNRNAVFQYEENDILVKKINHPKDTNPRFTFDVEQVKVSDITTVLDRFNAYDDKCKYEKTGNNCNAFTNTIWNGKIPKALKDKTFRFPSINTIMSSKYFE